MVYLASSNLAESRFESEDAYYARLAQPAEAPDLRSDESEFESQGGYEEG